MWQCDNRSTGVATRARPRSFLVHREPRGTPAEYSPSGGRGAPCEQHIARWGVWTERPSTTDLLAEAGALVGSIPTFGLALPRALPQSTYPVTMTTIELTVSEAFKALIESAATDYGVTPSQFVQDYILTGLKNQLAFNEVNEQLAASLAAAI